MNERYDYIIIGSGAGGSAAAYATWRNAGRRVLLLEKGPELPRDGSTLDVDKVIRQGIFKSKEPGWTPRPHLRAGGIFQSGRQNQVVRRGAGAVRTA
jgi:choline dehydrogenase-like flavoprotein